jgi:signal transduction histidine kinase
VIDLSGAAREVAADFETRARECGVEIEVRCQDRDPPRIVGDDGMLHLLLRNLVENALRHAPRGGRVRLEVRREEGGAALAVSDSGPGVPAALRTRIFDRFFRGDHPGAEGSGLGLSIVQRVVDLHGGRIRAEASAELGGLAMTVTFREADKETLRRAA